MRMHSYFSYFVLHPSQNIIFLSMNLNGQLSKFIIRNTYIILYFRILEYSEYYNKTSVTQHQIYNVKGSGN